MFKYRNGKEFLKKYIECEKNKTPLLRPVIHEFIRNADVREVGYLAEYMSCKMRELLEANRNGKSD